MIVLPAIDIKDGKCVRLVRGDYETAHVVAQDYLETAERFMTAGAKWIHMVDLDGAKAASPVNTEIFLDVARHTPLQVEVGGGIRTMDTVECYLSGGVARVILGSAALKKPAFLREAVREYGERVAVSIDARDGLVASEGWLDTSETDYLSFAKEMEAAGVSTLIFTDIAMDGTLSGVNAAALQALSEEVSCRVIASGGVRTIEDIRLCAKMGLYGVIAGKSLYQGTLDLAEAVRCAKEGDPHAS